MYSLCEQFDESFKIKAFSKDGKRVGEKKSSYLSTSYPQNVENLRKLKLVEKVIHTGRQAVIKIGENRLIFCKELLDLKGFYEYNGLDVFKTDQ